MKINLRDYQKRIFETARDKNALVVLPTGSGKTYIALSLILDKSGKKLFLAPTKPLVEQHKRTFDNISEREGVVLTGETGPEKRRNLWEENEVIFATPQTIRNDLKKNRISLERVSLIVYDEAHRAIGEYAYTRIQQFYRKQGEKRMVLGLTASPGHDEDKIREICGNLDISKIVMNSEEDIPGLNDKETIKLEVELPEDFKKASGFLDSARDSFLETMIEKNYIRSKKMSKTQLLMLQKKYMAMRRKNLFYAVSLITSCIKAWHAKKLLEVYGKEMFLEFAEKQKRDSTKASKRLMENPDFTRAVYIIQNSKQEHPKKELLKLILEQEGKKKAIVFTQYKTAAEMIQIMLQDKSHLFVGQSKMSQREQAETIQKFEKSEFQILIATSIGEEGLHIPDVDLAIFYEPVPSALRMIQRRGRVGRTRFGKIYVFVTKKTSDESNYYTSIRKEKNMKKSIINVEEQLKRRDRKIDEFKI